MRGFRGENWLGPGNLNLPKRSLSPNSYEDVLPRTAAGRPGDQSHECSPAGSPLVPGFSSGRPGRHGMYIRR